MRYSEESLRKVGMSKTQGEYKKAGCNLSEWVEVFPTPLAAESKKGGKTQTSLRDVIGGKLNPTWVEWLMGFPIGWTDLDV